MASIKLKFRASTTQGKAGTLFYRIIHNREVRQINTDLHIFACEWDNHKEHIIPFNSYCPRYDILCNICNKVDSDLKRLTELINENKSQNKHFTVDDIVSSFSRHSSEEELVLRYTQNYILKLRQLGRMSSADNTNSMLQRFKAFRQNEDLCFSMLTPDLIMLFEAHMKARGNTRNTTSFYMRSLRAVCNHAKEYGCTVNIDIFNRVYTGVDKTIKRAISGKHIKRIMALNLSSLTTLDFARDLFLFSFCTRGMSFIDIAFLRKKDISNGIIIYRRHKSGQQLFIKLEKVMQQIIAKYTTKTQYLFPIITKEDGTERQQYRNALMLINRKLKKIGNMACIPMPLSMYTARHSWATIAHDMKVPLSVISEGLGHDSDINTQIYLASIKTAEVDKANRKIINDLLKYE